MKATKAKRKYRYVNKEDIEAGEEWRVNLLLDKDVALKVIEERDNKDGAEVVKLINSKLRKAYGIKAKK
jgi:hypothetical protein